MSLNKQGVGLAKFFNEAKENNKDRKKGNPEHYYPKLIIHKTKRASLYIFIPAIVGLVTSIIFHDLKLESNWTESILPVFIFSSLLLLLPISEEWEYLPWQSEAQQMERELKE
jgi:hypothetical protein